MITSYEMMPLGIYQKVDAIIRDKSLTKDEVNTAIISVLSGVPEKELDSMTFEEVRKYADKLSFLYEQPPIAKMKSRYQVGKFDCVVAKNGKRLTWAQFKDFNELIKVADSHPELMVSVFLIPKGAKYCDDSYDIEELHEAIRESLPITDVQAITAFFLRRLQQSTKITLICSALRMMVETMTAPKAVRPTMRTIAKTMMKATRSLESGDGFIKQIASLGLPILLGGK